MRYRRLGRSDLELSVLGLGSWLYLEDGDQDRADRVHAAAYDAGVNFFGAPGSGGPAASAVVAPIRRLGASALARAAPRPVTRRDRWPGCTVRMSWHPVSAALPS